MQLMKGCAPAVGLWLALSAPAAAAEDAYFVVVFGAQRPVVKAPRYSHSFATFAHLLPDGRLEAFTISWLPATADVRPLLPEPEQGFNFDLPTTLRLCQQNRMEVACWGPYRIHPDLWNRARWQRSRLESGQVLYKAYDGGSLDGRVSNCLHAIDFMARGPDRRLPYVIVAPANWGESGSYWIALTLRPWYLEPCRTHDWLFPRLGLDDNALIRYGLARNPTLNPVTRAVQAALQADLLPERVDCRP
jgi:hypothetical protein